ncbi:response regulator transcription factor [Microbacterium telephonicum]|uniref:DNA-binding response OmpR family regulator n=1 Tax=Microbacterium telephonicum TaxID=1714841 RepID=A0A498BWH0_9MICO|nr:response regulator transcription factor [Microbacterium telephonicum]RLK48004.1 DNA-binding response OmpR family regulator [Microbacterium telephonicum]
MGRNTAVVIDDDPDVRALIVNILSSSGFDVIETDNGVEGVEAVFSHDPVITTLDVNMPGIDGYETARRIRERSSTYIVIITALTDEADAVLGFSVGADDVVVKPFRARELRARLLAAQRRQVSTATPAVGAPVIDTLGWNGLKLVRGAHVVTVDDEPVSLTRTEFDLLATILESAPDVRSKADLVHSVRDDPRLLPVRDADERAIETHMANLRRKLGESAATPRFIETVRGVGYRAITSPVEV